MIFTIIMVELYHLVFLKDSSLLSEEASFDEAIQYLTIVLLLWNTLSVFCRLYILGDVLYLLVDCILCNFFCLFHSFQRMVVVALHVPCRFCEHLLRNSHLIFSFFMLVSIFSTQNFWVATFFNIFVISKEVLIIYDVFEILLYL